LYWWGLDFSAFDKKGVFSRISLILTAFHEFVLFFTIHRNLCVRFTNLSLSLALSLKFVRSAQNYGEWRKIGQIREKQSKSKKFVKKHLFFVKRWEILVPTNPTRFNRDKYSEKMTDSSLSLWTVKKFDCIITLQSISRWLLTEYWLKTVKIN
jgi:hypothetical protein